MARAKSILFAALGLLVCIPGFADVGALDPLAKPSTRLGPGYLVTLQVSVNGTNEPELCGSFRLDGQGRLHLTVGFQPIDPIGILGLTCQDAKGRVVSAIKRFYRGKLETEIGVAQIPRIQVLTEGAFARRGIITLAEGARLTDLFTESTYLANANLSRVRIIRIGESGARPEIMADYSKALEGRVDDLVNDPTLHHGDRIMLEARRIAPKETFVVVHGEVRKPGKTAYFAGMTIKDALKAADGLLDTADADNVTLYRARDQSTSTISAERAAKGVIVDDLELGPGDAIMVHRADSGLRYAVLGSVAAPQTFRWRGKVTLTKAIADAGGFRPDADRSKVTILRNMLADPAQAIPVTVNFDLIARGSYPDPELDPGTVITVPQRVRANNHLLDLGIFLLRMLVL